ncbi:hypothetical protein VN24_24795 [Paenibacillus beijingensis]|uniref:Lipoprotein n=2 Tax=Paenibacillus beijingensis TaxID=1126833 RepID=A0A0D5NS67_9BACL|nr:hypothetical protein VN24_24795 [Paenibacillus beijingensis]
MIALSLSGCMYPQERRAQGGPVSKDAVRAVQAAVDDYKRDTGLLPIKNSDQSTPFYEKFVVDLGKLQRMRYLDTLPAAAFESGGGYYFLVLDEQTKPRVKLMSLLVYQQLADIQGWVSDYSASHSGNLPKGEETYPGFNAVDYAKLGRSALSVRSMYSGNPVPVMMDGSGRVYADYARDIMAAVQKNGLAGMPADTDLRILLVDQTDFVPVKSPVYKLVRGEPRPQLPETNR